MSETFGADVLEERGPAAVAACGLAAGSDLPLGTLDAITSARGFGELPDLAGQILAGQVRGRVVIEIGR